MGVAVHLSDKAIEEFNNLHEKHYGQKLPVERAAYEALQLIALVAAMQAHDGSNKPSDVEQTAE